MTPGLADIRLVVVDDEILVALPGTSYTVTYYKPQHSPQLLAKHMPYRNDPRAQVTPSGVPCANGT